MDTFKNWFIVITLIFVAAGLTGAAVVAQLPKDAGGGCDGDCCKCEAKLDKLLKAAERNHAHLHALLEHFKVRPGSVGDLPDEQ